MADNENLNLPIFISRKIWVTEKLCNFHTVQVSFHMLKNVGWGFIKEVYYCLKASYCRNGMCNALVNQNFVWNVAKLAQCGNYGNLLSHFCGKSFVEATFSLKKFLKSWFHEKLFSGSEFLNFPHCEAALLHLKTVWKNAKFTVTEKIFREINTLETSVIKKLLSQNFCQNVWE